MESSRRPTVYVEHQDDKIIVPFNKCILDVLGTKEDCGSIEYRHEGKEDLTLRKVESSNLKIYHPITCPLRTISDEERSKLPTDQPMNIGVTTFLLSKDGYVLLIRRAKHLRLFPGLWVLPGGHMEKGETLLEAGLRELHEETGINLTQKDYVRVEEMCAFESCYPPFKEQGLPKRRHFIMIYLLASDYDMKNLDDLVKVCPREADASMWLHKSVVDKIVRGNLDDSVEPIQQRKVEKGETKCSIIDPKVLSPHSLEKSTNATMERLSTSTFVAFQVFSDGNL